MNAIKLSKKDFLLLPAILAYVIVAVTGILNMVNHGDRIIAVALLAVFALAFFLPSHLPHGHWVYILRMSILTIVTACLIIFQPGWGVFPILFFLLGPQAMSWFSQRAGLVWTGVFSLITLGGFALAFGVVGVEQSLIYIPGFWFFAIFGWMRVQAVKDKSRSEELLVELQQAHQQLQEYVSRIEEMAIVQERNRIAREMHDSLGHRLTVVSVQLEGAQRLISRDPSRAENILETVREQVREGLSDLRRTVAILRASVDEELPLGEAVQKLARQFEDASHLKIHLNLENDLSGLPALLRQTLFRTVQEGLTNIQRHAEASEAWIQISQQEDCITLLVSDNGKGIDIQSEGNLPGFGLTGLRERAIALGGEFHIDRRPGGGTQLTFRAPYMEVMQDEPANCL